MSISLNHRLIIFRNKAILVISICLLNSCITVPIKNITPDVSLYEDEAILITKIRTNVENSYILIHNKDERWPIAKFKPVKPYEDLRVVKVRSGKLYFSKVGRGKSFVWGPRNYFTIMPKTITYVGDLIVEWAAEKGGVVAYIISVDREEKTVAEARAKYPWAFEIYPYHKTIPNHN